MSENEGEEVHEWAKTVEEGILLTSSASVFQLGKGTSECDTVENRLREVFGHGEEYDWALVIEEEEDADQELLEQRGLSTAEDTDEEIIVDTSRKEVEVDKVVMVEEVVVVGRKKRRREEDILLEKTSEVDGPRARKRPSRY